MHGSLGGALAGAFVGPADWLLLVVVVVGLAGRAWFGMRALRRLTPAQAAARRPRLWARAIGTQWLLVAALVALWLVNRRNFGELFLVPRATWGLGGVVAGVVMLAGMMRGQRRTIAERPELVARVRAQLAGVEPLMPHSHAEWPGFASLAVTAGVCEELLFRGFVTWMLWHVLPVFWVCALGQAVLFGLAHAYQGPRGVLLTGAVGLFMAGVVWITGSLWAAMLLHALMDLHSGDLARRVLELDPGSSPAAAPAPSGPPAGARGA